MSSKPVQDTHAIGGFVVAGAQSHGVAVAAVARVEAMLKNGTHTRPGEFRENLDGSYTIEINERPLVVRRA